MLQQHRYNMKICVFYEQTGVAGLKNNEISSHVNSIGKETHLHTGNDAFYMIVFFLNWKKKRKEEKETCIHHYHTDK